MLSVAWDCSTVTLRASWIVFYFFGEFWRSIECLLWGSLAGVTITRRAMFVKPFRMLGLGFLAGLFFVDESLRGDARFFSGSGVAALGSSFFLEGPHSMVTPLRKARRGDLLF